ncbi:hypothetical protein [Paludisphaera soli]|uniref:hypothetical protein n=1 Tax=Paludisphaera soli TaxID=2712865 RepID=UPI0013ED9710|nr:hypothetical protein [Paludisphaera soli]
METTYRRPPVNLYLGIGSVIFSLFFGLVMLIFLPEGANRAARLALSMFLALMFLGASAWIVLDYRRASLTFRGSRMIVQGVARRVEIDLADVVEARWRSEPTGGGLVLRDGANRLALGFGAYELARDEREAVVARLREAIRPEVQEGWNLFAYKTRFGETTPRPGDVLATRADWTRIFIPALLASALLAAVGWWWTRHPSLFGVVPIVAALWLLFRAVTPVDGVLARDLSRRSDPDFALYLAFLAAWLAIAVVGIAAFSRFGRWLPHSTICGAAGLVAWFAGLFLASHRQERREARRVHEAAELAAAVRSQSEGPSSRTAHTPPAPAS